MRQASILGWVKPKPAEKAGKAKTDRQPPRYAYRFLMDFPEGIMLPGEKPFPPIKKGDLISQNAMPPSVWAVLLERKVVEPVRLSF